MSLRKNLVGLMTRGCYRVICSVGYSWESYISLSPEAREEERWWLDNLDNLNIRGQSIRPLPSIIKVDQKFTGDASGVGLYLMKDDGDNRTLVSESLSGVEVNMSSCQREVLVFHRFYTGSGAEMFQGQTILHLTDNQAIASVLRKGSRNPGIHQLCVEVFLVC